MTKDFYECRIQEWGYWYRSIVSKALDSFKFKSFNVNSLAFSVRSPASRAQELEPSVQSPASRVQCPQSSVQSPASRVQRPESSVRSSGSNVQSPASNSCVQSPGTPVCPQNPLWDTIFTIQIRLSGQPTWTMEDNIAESLGNIHNIVKSLENKVIAYVKISTKFFFQIWKTQ